MRKDVQVAAGSILVLLLLIGVVAASVTSLWQTANGVRAFWDGTRIKVMSNRNGLVVTHLVGYSQGQPVVAALPEPDVTLDSGGPTLDAATLKAMKWKSPQGKILPAPIPGTGIQAIYYRPTFSPWGR